MRAVIQRVSNASVTISSHGNKSDRIKMSVIGWSAEAKLVKGAGDGPLHIIRKSRP